MAAQETTYQCKISTYLYVVSCEIWLRQETTHQCNSSLETPITSYLALERSFFGSLLFFIFLYYWRQESQLESRNNGRWRERSLFCYHKPFLFCLLCFHRRFHLEPWWHEPGPQWIALRAPSSMTSSLEVCDWPYNVQCGLTP